MLLFFRRVGREGRSSKSPSFPFFFWVDSAFALVLVGGLTLFFFFFVLVGLGRAGIFFFWGGGSVWLFTLSFFFLVRGFTPSFWYIGAGGGDSDLIMLF